MTARPPRYAPRSHYKSRLATEEAGPATDFAATTLDRPIVSLPDLAHLAARAARAAPTMDAPRVARPPDLKSPLEWLPLVVMGSSVMGALFGTLLALA